MSKEDSELKKVERVNFTMTNETNILRIGLLTTSWLKMKKNYGMGHTSKKNFDKANQKANI